MWLTIPTIDSIIASTSPTLVAYFNAVLPFVFFSLGIMVAVAVAIFVMNVFIEGFNKLIHFNDGRHGSGWSSEDEEKWYKGHKGL